MRAKALLWIVTLAILAFPRTSDAGLIDVILEMSGPQLIGFGLECDLAVDGDGKPECTILGIRLGSPGPEVRRRRVWVNVLAAAYVSTGRDGKENGQQIPFSGFETRMVGFDPMVAVRWSPDSWGSHRLHVGGGFSLNRFFGADIDTFNNWAFKVRPLAWDWDRAFLFWGRQWTLGAAYNLRVYPNGFDASPTGGLASTSERELVHGFLVGLSY
jgi:hypothetical protein